MYDFKNIDELGELAQSSIQTVFNGNNLDTVIPGFRTLNVNGRALIGQELEIIKVPAKDGAILTENRIEPREITVSYVLVADSNEDFRERFNRLNLVLHTVEPKELLFTDELKYSFKALLHSADVIEESNNTVKGSFTFLCLDPFKYSEVKQQTSTTIMTINQLPSNLEEVPVLIKVVVGGSVDKLSIVNSSTTKKIIINHNFTPNDKVEIDFNSEYILKINNQIRADKVDFIETDYDLIVPRESSPHLQ